MKRAKPYKIFLVLAIVAAGVVCMLLPDKKVMPTASMKGAVEKSNMNVDSTDSTIYHK